MIMGTKEAGSEFTLATEDGQMLIANWKKLKSPDIFVDMDFLVNVSSAKSKADKTTAGVGRGES